MISIMIFVNKVLQPFSHKSFESFSRHCTIEGYQLTKFCSLNWSEAPYLTCVCGGIKDSIRGLDEGTHALAWYAAD